MLDAKHDSACLSCLNNSIIFNSWSFSYKLTDCSTSCRLIFNMDETRFSWWKTATCTTNASSVCSIYATYTTTRRGAEIPKFVEMWHDMLMWVYVGIKHSSTDSQAMMWPCRCLVPHNFESVQALVGMGSCPHRLACHPLGDANATPQKEATVRMQSKRSAALERKYYSPLMQRTTCYFTFPFGWALLCEWKSLHYQTAELIVVLLLQCTFSLSPFLCWDL